MDQRRGCNESIPVGSRIGNMERVHSRQPRDTTDTFTAQFDPSHYRNAYRLFLYRLMLRKHIVPALRERLLADVEHKDILTFHTEFHHMPTVANRAVDILVKMFNLADAWGWHPSGSNPCRGVPRFKVEKHERFLTREALYRLGQALRAAPAEPIASTHAAAAIRLLVLTGCRRNEILGLRWNDLNFQTGEMRQVDGRRQSTARLGRSRYTVHCIYTYGDGQSSVHRSPISTDFHEVNACNGPRPLATPRRK